MKTYCSVSLVLHLVNGMHCVSYNRMELQQEADNGS